MNRFILYGMMLFSLIGLLSSGCTAKDALNENIYLGGDIIWAGDNSGFPYGSYYGNEFGFSSAVNNSFVLVTDSLTSGPLNRMAFNVGGLNRLQIQESGLYLVNWYLCSETSTPNHHVKAGIMLDSTTAIIEPGTNHTEHPSPNKELSMSGSAIIEIESGSFIGIGIGSEDNTTVIASHIGLTIVMIGG